MSSRRVRTTTARARGAASQELATRSSREEYRRKGSKEYETVGGAEEKLDSATFAPGESPAYVTVSTGGTYNLQNFESLRLDVSVTLPCRPDEVEETFEQASEFVADKLGELEAEWMPKPRKK